MSQVEDADEMGVRVLDVVGDENERVGGSIERRWWVKMWRSR